MISPIDRTESADRGRRHTSEPATFLALALVLCVAACGTPSLPRHAQMHRSLPQDVVLEATVPEAWDALLAEVHEDPDRHVLAEDGDLHLVSWTEALSTAELVFVQRLALFQDLSLAMDMSAIVVARLDEAGDGSRLRLRCTLYPHDSVESISASRGSYEERFVSDIEARLRP